MISNCVLKSVTWHKQQNSFINTKHADEIIITVNIPMCIIKCSKGLDTLLKMDNHGLNKLLFLFKQVNLTSKHGTSEQLFDTNTVITVTHKTGHYFLSLASRTIISFPQTHNYIETLYLPNTMSDLGTSCCCTQYATPTYQYILTLTWYDFLSIPGLLVLTPSHRVIVECRFEDQSVATLHISPCDGIGTTVHAHGSIFNRAC